MLRMSAQVVRMRSGKNIHLRLYRFCPINMTFTRNTIFDQGRVNIIDQVVYGLYDRLDIYPLCGIFYLSWHRHHIEGSN